jgi:hypothetical protein
VWRGNGEFAGGPGPGVGVPKTKEGIWKNDLYKD